MNEVAVMRRLIHIPHRHPVDDLTLCRRQILSATIVGILCVLALWKLAVLLGAFPH